MKQANLRPRRPAAARRIAGHVSTKYRCHRVCHLQMSLLGGRGRASGGRGAPA